MAKILLGTGNFTWDAIERRSDRYGSVRLTKGNDGNVLINRKFDALEGKHGVLFAEVIKPVKSPHMGDLQRGFKVSLPEVGEVVLFGQGELFIEHRGEIHEKGGFERSDDEFMEKLQEAFQRMGMSTKGLGIDKLEKPEVYDLVGLKPDDGRTTDWLNPRSFYRLHLSKINLYFEEKNDK